MPHDDHVTGPPPAGSPPSTPQPAAPQPGAAQPAEFQPSAPPLAAAHPARSAPPRHVRSGLSLVAVFLGGQLTMLLVSVVVLLSYGSGDAALLEDGRLLALLVLPTSLGAVVAVVGTGWLGGGPRLGRVARELAVRWNVKEIAIGLALGLGGLALTLPAAAVWAAWVGEDQAGSAVGDAFAGRELGLPAAVLVFLAIWLVAPLAEEVLFRGVLWRALEHLGWNRWVVFVATSLVFSIAHLELLRTPLLLVLSIPIGLARLLTGNLLASVVAHQVNNLLPAIALLLATTGNLP
ncbi:CPBP family intramembrane glutamic endopeptidase [Saccharothrix luteola]|uniref:CPBP family intramembrane glutamic endopeptidase n=1 Tax=Saccharothrix luteola TaxID=2893018 RepID=UPI001E368C71|nr:CPBP family intramembrane glutamic endopeptidase [Saccharothrix luteola]MCC8249348.1 CPBP family intramembrane metalloprotease [Saccharothrix luteola]